MTRESRILILGTDEAGYGPNLGPLLVGASCWLAHANFEEPDVPDPNSLLAFATPERDLAPSRSPDRLNAALAPVSGTAESVFPLLDSKALYGASKSLAALERSFMLASALLGRDASSFDAILRDVRSESADPPPPWEENTSLAIPADPETLQEPLEPALATVRERLADERVALLDLAARRVQPKEFNATLERVGLKSALIADATTSLVVETLADALEGFNAKDAPRPANALVLCDKLGGRNHYSPTLRERFPGAEIATLCEGRAESGYRFVAASGRDRYGATRNFPEPIEIEIRFTAKGETNVPTALASIAAKYLRELSMRFFNEFWQNAASPDEIAPTAGYPVDARRFRDDVDGIRRKLNVLDEMFWRNK